MYVYASLKVKEYRQFENIKYVRQDGSEYWSVREFADVFDYSQWRNFQKVIDRAMIACENSGHEVEYDSAEVSKIVEAGTTSKSIKGYEFTSLNLVCTGTSDLASYGVNSIQQSFN